MADENEKFISKVKLPNDTDTYELKASKLGDSGAASYVKQINGKTATNSAISIGLDASTSSSANAVKYIEDTSFDSTTGTLTLTTKYLKLN